MRKCSGTELHGPRNIDYTQTSQGRQNPRIIFLLNVYITDSVTVHYSSSNLLQKNLYLGGETL